MTGRPTPDTISTKQERIAELARQMPDVALRSLSRHIDLDWMREAHRRTRKGGATGVDGQSGRDFEEALEENLQRLLDEAKSGRYRAPPVRRVEIPKGRGETRPIGVPTFADKVLQRSVYMALEPVYEQDFYDFSYGFRPGRSAHDALEFLQKGLFRMGGGWVLDADVSSFFDTLDHRVLRDLLRQRVVDGVVVRLVGKWLRAGVLDGGVVHRSATGTPQGGVISPLLANIYLHSVLDRWWVEEVLPRLAGQAFAVRYADDFLLVFSNREDALRVQGVLPQRFERFGLTLHPEKTRLVRFERPRGDDDPDQGPGTFEFLGFTHFWERSRKGRWIPKRKTATTRLSRALRVMNSWCKRARHWPVPDQARLLRAKLRGHYNYYGITGNWRSITIFYRETRRLWRRWLSRRSQRAYLTWKAFEGLLARHPLPPPRVVHDPWRPANP